MWCSTVHAVLPGGSGADGGALLLPAVGGAEPARDALIRPGKGIGKVSRGMTFDQVKRVLGKPRTVVNHVELASSGRYVDRQWELEGALGSTTWTVGSSSGSRSAPPASSGSARPCRASGRALGSASARAFAISCASIPTPNVRCGTGRSIPPASGSSFAGTRG